MHDMENKMKQTLTQLINALPRVELWAICYQDGRKAAEQNISLLSTPDLKVFMDIQERQGRTVEFEIRE